MRVLVGGCFNLIHPGHIYFLNRAKKLGTHLTVVLAHKNNNKKRIVKTYSERRQQILKLKIVDNIIKGHPIDFNKVLKKVKPDIIVLGYDQELPPRVTFSKVIRIDKYKNYSSSLL
jgi:FAD synthetase